ncbi:hypothetical protein GCM10008090_28790 [Arenicella chitinivorans]|uniref:MarR family transcriptional regulator n=1 Tax=Arenicella chitinivorans TaxID=1329800 RepID=A0A918RYH0_9GAMM|nr:transcriptional regulator [Arenicella chitinivorans]GHA17340.1 hypothetical protein GCM10008090_28790 [Arenicella chitinivorans]
MKKLTQTEIEFIEYTGLKMQADGLPKIAGQIFAVVVLEEEPISFSNLVDRLKVSRGSVSTNTRLLESLGVLDRVSLMGERQDYFKLPDSPYTQLFERKKDRLVDHMKLLKKTVSNMPKNSFKQKRVQDQCRVTEVMIENIEDLINALKKI